MAPFVATKLKMKVFPTSLLPMGLASTTNPVRLSILIRSVPDEMEYVI